MTLAMPPLAEPPRTRAAPGLLLARLPWPAPALMAWLAGWALWWLAGRVGAPAGLAWVSATGLGAAAALAWPAVSAWRRGLIGLGFPASALGLGLAPAVPAWAWLLPLAMLLAAYPLKAWRDAPLFPTPPQALQGLADVLPLPLGALVLDAGCGLGQGLDALRREWPGARLHGVEWSRPLAWLSRWRCRHAQVRQGDMWRGSWQPYTLVYLFQRPESMARAWAKACAEMAPGSWLVSLDFAVPEVAPHAVLRQPGAQPVWLYRLPGAAVALAQSAATLADKHRNMPAVPGRA